MTQYVPIEINRDLVRDVSNRALLNTNLEELKTYYAERDLRLKELQEKQTMEQKVNKLEEDITDIKDMLRELVQMKAPNGN
jgi:predicted nuclease with TOPRIM domain